MIDTIEFNGVEYPVRDVVVDGVGTVNVSTESLAAAINPTDDWNDVSEEALYIDNKVYFYVPNELIRASNKVLYNYVKDNY